MASQKQDPQEWHGHRIVSGEEIAEYFDAQDPDVAVHARKRRRRIRLILITVLIIIIGAATWFAFQIIRGQASIPGWGHAEISETAACPSDTRTYLDPAEVTVNVYNATTKEGFAGAAADALLTRGFNIGEVSNARLADQNLSVLIVTGEQGFDHAFTVQKHFNGVKVITDSRRDEIVDVVVNEGHKGLKNSAKVNEAAGVLECLHQPTDQTELGSEN